MKNNYLRGFLGALLGGIVCTIPWILMYVYLNFMFSLLGAVIGFGAFFGYKLFGGKVTKKTALIVTVASIISITVATFVVIPLLLVVKEGLGLSWYYFNYLYTNGDFITGIIMDYIISVVFTFLGISGVIANINKEGALNESKESNDTTFVDPDKLSYEEQIKYLESIYAKYDAFSKDKAVSEFKIMKEINVPNKFLFMQKMEKSGVIVAPLIKSWFDKEAVNNPERAKKNFRKSITVSYLVAIPIGIIIGLAVIFGIIALTVNDTDTNTNNSENEQTQVVQTTTYSYEKINIDLPNTFKEIPEEEENTNISYLNHGNGNIYQVMLQQETFPKGTDKKTMRDLYIENLKTSFTIVDEQDVNIDGVDGFYLDSEYKSDYGVEFFRTYVAFTDTDFIVVMFYTNLYNEKTDTLKDAKIKDFKEEVLKYAETIKIKKS